MAYDELEISDAARRVVLFLAYRQVVVSPAQIDAVETQRPGIVAAVAQIAGTERKPLEPQPQRLAVEDGVAVGRHKQHLVQYQVVPRHHAERPYLDLAAPLLREIVAGGGADVRLHNRVIDRCHSYIHRQQQPQEHSSCYFGHFLQSLYITRMFAHYYITAKKTLPPPNPPNPPTPPAHPP